MKHLRLFYLQLFFKLLLKLSDFINSDEFIEKKSHQNLSNHIQFLFNKRFELNKKKGLFLVKKTKNSGNHIQDYAHSFRKD